MSPMENGIRVTSGVELTDRDAPSSFAQLDMVVPMARGVVEFGSAVAEPWRGARPTLPDRLPMIGAAPPHPAPWIGLANHESCFLHESAHGAQNAARICT